MRTSMPERKILGKTQPPIYILMVYHAPSHGEPKAYYTLKF